MNGKVSAVKSQLNHQTVEKTELIQPESESVYLIPFIHMLLLSLRINGDDS